MRRALSGGRSVYGRTIVRLLIRSAPDCSRRRPTGTAGHLSKHLVIILRSPSSQRSAERRSHSHKERPSARRRPSTRGGRAVAFGQNVASDNRAGGGREASRATSSQARSRLSVEVYHCAKQAQSKRATSPCSTSSFQLARRPNECSSEFSRQQAHALQLTPRLSPSPFAPTLCVTLNPSIMLAQRPKRQFN